VYIIWCLFSCTIEEDELFLQASQENEERNKINAPWIFDKVLGESHNRHNAAPKQDENLMSGPCR